MGKEHDRFTKTIVFCETEEHAGAMRDYLANENADLMKESNQRYVMRITANDQAGKDQIKNFSSTRQKERENGGCSMISVTQPYNAV